MVTEDGIVLAEQADEFLLTIKVYQHEKDILPREKFTTKEYLEKIQKGKTELEALELPVKEMRYMYNAREIHYISRNDMEIWVDLQLPIEDQIKKLKYGSKKIRLYSKEFHHIDLRIPKQIFWEWL